jgi:hypothetical protein
MSVQLLDQTVAELPQAEQLLSPPPGQFQIDDTLQEDAAPMLLPLMACLVGGTAIWAALAIAIF